MLHDSDIHRIRQLIGAALEPIFEMFGREHRHSDLVSHLHVIERALIIMAHTLTETRDEVRSMRTVVESYRALFAGLKQQLVDALAAAGQLTPEAQAIADEIFDESHELSGEIADDIAANTPAPAPAPPPADPADVPGG